MGGPGTWGAFPHALLMDELMHAPISVQQPEPKGAKTGAAAIRSLYVHAPFCSRRCFYCDYAVKVAPPDADEWLRALALEVRALEQEGEFNLDSSLDTIYVGGGTPSLLGWSAMDGLARVVGEERLRGSDLEWTVEANPESFTEDVARGWRRAGVTRVSLGVQTFHGPSLRWMGRMHGAEGARSAVRIAREAGLNNISIDLVFGLPSYLGRDWEYDLSQTLALEVDHVSLYGLTVESKTPLGRAVKQGRETLPTDQRCAEEYLFAVERLTEAEFEAYEISNFARMDQLSQHNMIYWSGRPYLGVGNGAHSYKHPVRRWNFRDWDVYRAEVHKFTPPLEGEETLGEDESRLERIWLGLRSWRGLSVEGFPYAAEKRVRRWLDSGFGIEKDGVLRLTPRGWLVIDRLTVELDGDFHRALTGSGFKSDLPVRLEQFPDI